MSVLKKMKKPFESFKSPGFPLQIGVDVSKLPYAKPLTKVVSDDVEYDTYLFKEGIKSIVAVAKLKDQENLTMFSFSVAKVQEYLEHKGYFAEKLQSQMSLYSPLDNIISAAKEDSLASVFLLAAKNAQDKGFLDADFSFIVEELKPKKTKINVSKPK